MLLAGRIVLKRPRQVKGLGSQLSGVALGRPAVAQDGGDITFRGYENGTVFLNMKGACAGCPSSTATLKHGIESLLKHYVPEVTEVRAA